DFLHGQQSDQSTPPPDDMEVYDPINNGFQVGLYSFRKRPSCSSEDEESSIVLDLRYENAEEVYRVADLGAVKDGRERVKEHRDWTLGLTDLATHLDAHLGEVYRVFDRGFTPDQRGVAVDELEAPVVDVSLDIPAHALHLPLNHRRARVVGQYYSEPARREALVDHLQSESARS